MSFFLGATGAAQASFEGTPGKVAFLDAFSSTNALKLWDPVTEVSTTVEPLTWEAGNTGTAPPFNDVQSSEDFPFAPSWSPDGTKLVYSKTVADPGDFAGLRHGTIWVYNVSTGQKTQITFPEQSLVDKNSNDMIEIGHIVGDSAPSWSPDGNTIAFVRTVQTLGKDDVLVSKNGQNLWRTTPTGGTATRVTNFDQDSVTRIWGGVWIPNSQDLVVSYTASVSTWALGRINIAGGAPQLLVSAPSGMVITDYDASPDGTKLSYSVGGGGGFAQYVRTFAGGATVLAGTLSQPTARFAGSGDGLLVQGCTDRSPSVCGLMNLLTPDNGADIAPGETSRLALAWSDPVGGTGGNPARMGFDVQPQTLPIVFVPGFLGSIINCGAQTLWPGVPHTDAPAMRLGIDGLTNEGCAGTAPSGALVETAAGQDVYASTANFLRNTFPGGRATLFGWDWRKRPQESLSRLETAVNDALDAPGPWKDQGTKRVMLAGHSYGGILIRVYLKEHPEKVARALTLGTPYWGAPKSIFPLAYGIETPVGGPGIDALFFNSELHQLAVNLAGLYQLYPSENFGPWLSVGGTTQAGSALSAFVFSIGGNTALLGQARNYHSSLYDGFFDNGQRIDVRAVVGTGVPTFSALDFTDQGKKVYVTLKSGDGTVPARSGIQGPVGTRTPLGDPIHIQYLCGVKHVPLAGDGAMLDAYKDFFDLGRTPRRLQLPCDSGGGILEFSPGTLGTTRAPTALRAAANPFSLAAADAVGLVAANPFSLADADAAGLIDLVTLPEQVLAITSADQPVTLRFTITDDTFTWTPFTGDGNGAPLVYGPINGTVEISTAGAGAPTVTVDGQVVAPQSALPTGVGGQQTPPPVDSTGAIAAVKPVSAPAVTLASNRFSVVGKPRLKARTITLTVVLPGPGVLAIRATARKGLPTLARSKVTVRAQGKRTVTLKFKRPPPSKVRLAISFSPSGGTPRMLTMSVARRR